MNRHSVWRYVLISVLIILGVVYALPNLYGDDSAVQVSAKGGAVLSDDVEKQLSQVLTQNHIEFKSIENQPTGFLIRLVNADQQAEAQDIIQAATSNKYNVALNLAPRTPTWLQAIGAQPMRLGLDLRGGIHFLLQVDTKNMLKQQTTTDMHTIGDQLRDGMIRYSGILPLKDDGILIWFTNLEAREQAVTALKTNFNQYIFTSKQNGSSYLLQMVMTKQAALDLTQYAVQQNLSTLRRRINALGVSEPVIAQQGADQISIDLPGVQDTARAKEQIGTVATVRLQLQDLTHDAMIAQRTGIVPFGDTLYQFGNQPVLLKNQALLTGTSITSATLGIDDNGRPAVNIRLGGSSVSYFNKMTAANVGNPLAVVYVQTLVNKKLIDGKVQLERQQVEKVINIATIQSALGTNFQIMGLSSIIEAKDLALQLQSGAYAAPVLFVAEQVVGASLGKQNIAMGVKACEIGSLFVFVFMLFYYRVFGLVANFALLLNVVFVVAIQSLLGFTMTLPGIAALVLTVGMAVDANVLINERIREELRTGLSARASVAAGYTRAFTTIFDANMSTLIVAAVLYAFGTGPVQGFAVTLSIGLLTSMLTAIFFTRALVDFIYGRRSSVRRLSIGMKITQSKP